MKKYLLSIILGVLAIAILGEIAARYFLPPQRIPDPLTYFEFNPRRFEILKINLREGLAPSTAQHLAITGGSTAFGWGATDLSHQFPTVLEKLIREKHPNRNVQVLNAGVPDFEAADELTLYVTLLSGLRPKTVIMMTGFNDLWGAMRGQLADAPDWRMRNMARRFAVPVTETRRLIKAVLQSVGQQIRNAAVRQSRLFEYLDRKMTMLNYVPLKNLANFDFEKAQSDLDPFFQAISAMHHLARKNGSRLIIVIQPMRSLTRLPQAEFPISRYEATLAALYRKKMKPRLQSFKHESAAAIYDLNEGLVDQLNRKNLFLDFCHLNDEGNLLLAKEIQRILERERVLIQ